MKDIFRLGDHTICGISLTYVKFNQLYMFMITLLLIHCTFHISTTTFRIGISIGDHEVFVRINLGINS